MLSDVCLAITDKPYASWLPLWLSKISRINKHAQFISIVICPWRQFNSLFTRTHQESKEKWPIKLFPLLFSISGTQSAGSILYLYQRKKLQGPPGAICLWLKKKAANLSTLKIHSWAQGVFFLFGNTSSANSDVPCYEIYFFLIWRVWFDVPVWR